MEYVNVWTVHAVAAYCLLTYGLGIVFIRQASNELPDKGACGLVWLISPVWVPLLAIGKLVTLGL